jgi:hypothetical protein
MGASVKEPSIYCHSVPGRVRLKLPALKGAARRAERLVAAMRQLPGVSDAVANPTTGSLVLHFDPRQTSLEAFVQFLREQGEIPRDVVLCGTPSPVAAAAREHPLATLAWTAGSALGREILKGALGHALRGTPWSLLLAVV